jgi:hypothetical protein
LLEAGVLGLVQEFLPLVMVVEDQLQDLVHMQVVQMVDHLPLVQDQMPSLIPAVVEEVPDTILDPHQKLVETVVPE